MHETTPFTSGTRQALVVSVWTKKNQPLALSNGLFHYEKPNHNIKHKTLITQNATITYEDVVIDAITPLGFERIIMKIPSNKTTGPVIYENQRNERFLINEYSYLDDDFSCTFNVESLMNATIKIFMTINRSKNSVNGYMYIDEYLIVELRGFIK
jgi:hypothetical protein